MDCLLRYDQYDVEIGIKFWNQKGGFVTKVAAFFKTVTNIVLFQDDLSSRPSDAETTDDDGDSSSVLAASGNLALSESIPNSPHSSHW